MSTGSPEEKKPSIRKLIKALAESEQSDLERKALRRLLTPPQFSECIEVCNKAKEAGAPVSMADVAMKKGYVTSEVLDAGIQTLKRSLGRDKGSAHQTSFELEAVAEGSGDVESDTIDVAPVADAVAAAKAAAGAKADLTGQQFGSFTLVKLVGGGPIGKTYSGRRVGSTVPVALKTYELSRLEVIGLPNLIFDRMRTVGQIKHPNLVQPLGCGRSTDGQYYYFAMEMIQGVNLNGLVERRRRLDEKTALAIAVNVAKGLAVTHAKGIIHGNLKPTNVLVSTGGLVRVSDTGLPRSSEYIVNRYVQGDLSGVTADEVVFVPPELIEGQSLQTSADTYGIGILLCFMLSGKVPYQGTPSDVIKKIASEYTSPLGVLDGLDIHQETRLVIETMVNRVPGWRYEDMTELVGALRGALNSLVGVESQVIHRSAPESGAHEVAAPEILPEPGGVQEPPATRRPTPPAIVPAAPKAPSPARPAAAGPSGKAPAGAQPASPPKSVPPAATPDENGKAGSDTGANTALLAMLEDSTGEDFQWQSGVFPGAMSAAMRSSPNILAVTPESFIGRTVGDWELQKMLGYGIVADMYLGRHTQTGQVAAVKVFLKQILNSQAAVLRFNSRCRASLKVSHANMLKTYDFGQSKDGYCYVAMEYLQGRSLKRLIRRNGFIPERMALGIIMFAARGLLSAHERGVMHGNLKPSNILVNRQGVVKVCDTGTPRSSEIVVDEALVKELPKELKPEAVAYIPPEIVIGAGDLKPETDAYGLGMVLYHMLTGRVPFKGTVAQIIAQIQKGEMPKFVTADDGTCEDVRILTLNMIHPDPEQRIRKMDIVIDEIRRILSSLRGKPQRAGASFKEDGDDPPSSEGLRLE